MTPNQRERIAHAAGCIADAYKAATSAERSAERMPLTPGPTLIFTR